jgi:hypothetical protein
VHLIVIKSRIAVLLVFARVFDVIYNFAQSLISVRDLHRINCYIAGIID